MTCNTHIGRMSAIGLAKETTPGTAVDPTVWIPVESAEVSPVIETVEDESGFGIIDRVAEVATVENTSETSLEGVVRAGTIGHLIMATLGTSASPILVETGVYKHTFSRLNSNCPLTYTITEDTPVGAKQAPYSAIDEIEISGEAGDYVKFSVKYVGGQIVTVADKTPAFTSEDGFLASGMSVKMGADVATIDAQPTLKLKSFKVTIAKGIEKQMELGSTNISSINNTVMDVTGDMELVYDSDSMMSMVVNGDKKVIKMKAESAGLIGSTKKAEIGALLPRVAFSEWSKSSDANSIITQTVGFTGTFSVAEAKTLEMWVQNKVATQY